MQLDDGSATHMHGLPQMRFQAREATKEWWGILMLNNKMTSQLFGHPRSIGQCQHHRQTRIRASNELSKREIKKVSAEDLYQHKKMTSHQSVRELIDVPIHR